MASTPHQRAVVPERNVYARRLALAAIASGLIHLLLWGGLTVTRLTLLGSKPQDATAPRPALKPKMVADFPLQVPKSPMAQPAHERPLDMQVMPRQPPDTPRTIPERSPLSPTVPQPEQPVPIAVTPPALKRPAALREPVAARAADDVTAPDRQRLATAAEPSAASTADPIAATPGADTNAPTPTPAAARRRSAEQESAGVSRRRPREVAMTAPPLPVAPSLPPRLPTSGSGGAAPAASDLPQPQAPSPAARRAAAEDAAAAVTTAAPLAPSNAASQAATAGTVPQATATAMPRPQSPTTSLADAAAREDRGGWAPLRSPKMPRDAAVDDSADSSAIREPAATPRAAAGIAVTRPGTGSPSAVGMDDAPARNAAANGAAIAGSAASPAPLARSSLTGDIGSATGPSAAADTIAVPAAVGTAGGASPNAVSATTAPSPRTISRLGDRLAASARGTTMATDVGEGDDAGDVEELSSLAEAGAIAGGLSARERGDASVTMIVPRPLDRVAAVTLPVDGRVREIAIPFARRSRASRDARGREQPASELAIREKTRVAADAMVDRGLDFLARAQQPDGRWQLGAFPGSTAADTPKLSCDTAATGLAILSFLGAGHDHFGGEHRNTVRRGLEFLLAVQKADGDLYLPSDKLSDSCAWLYSHGIATMALCEAVGMTGDPLVKPAAARACDFIAASQHPSRGGWRYTPRSDADLSVSGWMLVALRSGRLAGVDVEPRAFDGVKALLNASAITGDAARYHYNPRSPQQRPSQLSAGCMTAVGTLMRLHTGWTASDPRVQQSARALAAIRPTYGTSRTKEKTRDCYLWYYASQVLVHTGGEEWTDWYDQLASTLEKTQERAGPAAGSWDPLGAIPDRWGQYGGRIYVTALHLLALEVPDRRLPTYGSPEDAVKP
jgi:hypothetical protein